MKRIARLILIWIAVVIITLVGVHAIATAVTGARLRAAYAALEDAGRPLLAAQVIPAEIPEADNAAVFYLKAVEVIEQLGAEAWFGTLAEVAAEDALPTNALATARESLAKPEIRELLGLFESAATRTGCRFERDYSKGAALLLPEVGPCRDAARLVKLRALVQASDGKAEEAVKSLILGLDMGDAFASDPILICQLVRMAVLNMMLKTVHQVYALTPVPDTVSAELMEEIAARRGSNSFIRSLDGERLLFGEWAFNLFAGRKGADEQALLSDMSDMPIVVFYGGRLLRPLWQADHATYLRAMLALTKNALRPVYEAEPLDDRLDSDIPRYCILTRMLVPALGRVAKMNSSTEAGLALTQAGLALIRHKQRHGSYPQTTAAIDKDLLNEWPRDPFTGQPIIYRSTSEGTTLYSVGMNGVDEGGRESEKRDEGDIVWQLP